MEFSPEALARRLLERPAPRRYVALVSGGGDSMVLMEALAAVRDRLPAPPVVLHFDHGLDRDSRTWAEFVESRACALGLPFCCDRLALPSGGAQETRARVARYARLETWMQQDDCCLTAHHADDQAETFLLQALRGGGMAGLAAMPAYAEFGPGHLARPLLGWTRAELRAWAGANALDWIEDPANRDLRVPRNRLRERVWPLLLEGWPAAARTLSRSADLAAETEILMRELAAEDLVRLQVPGATCCLMVGKLRELSVPRRHNVLRYWLRACNLPLPSARKLRELDANFVQRDPGVRAVLAWPGVHIRRYRGRLYAHSPWPSVSRTVWRLEPGQPLDLGPLGCIGLVRSAEGPLAESLVGHELTIRLRAGGERIRPAGTAHRRKLKHLLREQSVVPWLRDRVPLLYAGDQLAAVPGVVEAAADFAGSGWRVEWSGAPPLH